MYQVKTLYQKEDIKAFHKLVGGYVSKTRLMVSRYSLIIVGAAMIVIGLTSVVSAPLLCLVCVVVGAAMLWPGIAYYDYLARKSWKIWNRVQGKGKPQLYTFDESTVTEGEGEQKITAPYSEVYAAYESEDHFFLFMSRRDGYIMKKSDFVEGDPAQFAAFLQEKTGRSVQKVTLQNIR